MDRNTIVYVSILLVFLFAVRAFERFYPAALERADAAPCECTADELEALGVKLEKAEWTLHCETELADSLARSWGAVSDVDFAGKIHDHAVGIRSDCLEVGVMVDGRVGALELQAAAQ